MKIEKYNAIIKRTIFKFESKRKNIQNLIDFKAIEPDFKPS